MKRGLLLFLCFLALACSSSLSSGKEIPKIAVWDLTPGNINPSYAQDLTSILVSEINKLGKYEVYSQENVRTLAGWTAERMTLGCTDTKCLTALGQMEISKLISGRVGRIGNTYTVSLHLFDTLNVKAENSVSGECRTEDELIGLIRQVVKGLLGESVSLPLPALKKIRIGPDVRMVISTSKDAVVTVYGVKQRDRTLGTGFFVNDRGYVLTNNHIISGMDKILVTTANSEFIADPVGNDPNFDLALLKISQYKPPSKDVNIPYLKIADAALVREGQWVVALGNPFGMSSIATAGVILKKNSVPEGGSINRGAYYLQNDAAVNPGNSGGPLLNLDGCVVGVNTALLTGEKGNYAISSEILRQFLSRYPHIPFHYQTQGSNRLDSAGPRWELDARTLEEFRNSICALSDMNDSLKRAVGSCFLTSSDGYILTAQENVKDRKEVRVGFADGSDFNGTVVGTDTRTGVALLKISPAKMLLNILPLGNSEAVKPGDWVIAAGNLLDYENSFSSGIVSASGGGGGQTSVGDFIQTDAWVHPSNNGGPLLNLKREVIGINISLSKDQKKGIGFALPVNTVRAILPQLKEEGRVTRGWVGLSIQKIPPEVARSAGIDERNGIYVQEVTKGGPAEKAGVMAGDVIFEFDQRAINEPAALPRIISALPIGKECEVKVLRGGKVRNMVITIGRLPGESR